MCTKNTTQGPISSRPVTTMVEKGSSKLPASNRGNSQVTTCLRRISGRYLVVWCNRGRTPKKVQRDQRRLAAKNFIVNEVMCVAFPTTLTLLGYEISSQGVRAEQTIVQKCLQLQIPKYGKEVEAFIGLISFFGRMITNPLAETLCINKLRQKDNPFKRTGECQKYFSHS